MSTVKSATLLSFENFSAKLKFTKEHKGNLYPHLCII